MALNILSIPASSVSSERLFSRAKLVSTDHRSRLGGEIFEAIECLHYHWHNGTVDLARENSRQAEEVSVDDELQEFIPLKKVQDLYTDFSADYVEVDE